MKSNVIIGLLLVILGSAQVYTWNLMSNLNAKVEKQSKIQPNATTDDYLLIGNSILANCDWGKRLNKSNIYNSSISGLTLFEANQFPSTFVNRKSKKIFVELGINDLNTEVPTKMVVYASAAFLGLVKKISPNSEVHFISVLPLNESIMKGKSTNTEIKEFNAKISAWARNNHIQYINAYSSMLDSEGQLNKIYTSDGLHLTEAGYEQLASVLKPYF
jgi:lysophospholipase L1-like esterase